MRVLKTIRAWMPLHCQNLRAEVLVGLSLVMVCGNAAGFFETGRGLLQSCDGDDVVQYTQCVGFLTGVADSIKTLVARKQIKKQVCIPGAVTGRELRATFSTYAKDNDYLLDIAASSVAIDAFRKRWPCP